jgi:anti-sigma-K factor RskA
MNIRHNDVLREKLSAEYVLGTLKGGARRRFEGWLGADAALRRAVAEWQDRLCPLAEMSPAVMPGQNVWRAIEKRIDGLSAKSAPHNAGFWRRLSMASSAIAVMLLVVLLVRQPVMDPAAPGSTVAVLADEQAKVVMVVTGDRRRLTVKVVAPQNIGTDKSLELWALPKGGAPRSLGLLVADGTITLDLPDYVTPQSVPALAVSLEPKGGSPNPNAPTGPVLYKGAWVAI